ncbi:hypothetical protein [uncultured Tateyamaria sp.]|nr:hypothetical protein [uncultured Tateyamaria sp.]
MLDLLILLSKTAKQTGDFVFDINVRRGNVRHDVLCEKEMGRVCVTV